MFLDNYSLFTNKGVWGNKETSHFIDGMNFSPMLEYIKNDISGSYGGAHRRQEASLSFFLPEEEDTCCQDALRRYPLVDIGAFGTV
jgi:hypothetical protein